MPGAWGTYLYAVLECDTSPGDIIGAKSEVGVVSSDGAEIRLSPIQQRGKLLAFDDRSVEPESLTGDERRCPLLVDARCVLRPSVGTDGGQALGVLRLVEFEVARSPGAFREKQNDLFQNTREDTLLEHDQSDLGEAPQQKPANLSRVADCE